MREAGLYKVQVLTIERAQGKENEVTVLSPVKFNSEFATDRNRANVAMTRATTQLLFVTDTDLIGEVSI